MYVLQFIVIYNILIEAKTRGTFLKGTFLKGYFLFSSNFTLTKQSIIREKIATKISHPASALKTNEAMTHQPVTVAPLSVE